MITHLPLEILAPSPHPTSNPRSTACGAQGPHTRGPGACPCCGMPFAPASGRDVLHALQTTNVELTTENRVLRHELYMLRQRIGGAA
jgi:hypothetical protein